MDKYITIRRGDFTATIDLEALDQLTLDNWKKLIRVAEYQLWDNAQAVQTAIDFITGMIQVKDKAWREASQDYRNGYRDHTFMLCKREKRETKTQNKKLMAKVKTAKHQKTIWEKRLEAIHERIPSDQLEYCLRAQK